MEYIGLVMDVVSSFFEWLSVLESRFHFISAVISIFVLGSIWRFILAPILGRGSGSSDTVKKERKR